MKKLKPIAYELMNLKTEMLNESYSKTIKQALELSIDQMLEKGFIDFDMQLNLKDKNYSLEKLNEYLEESNEFKKTKEELEIEYDNFVKIINEEMLGLGLMKDEFYCKVDATEEKIKICKIFCLKEEFLKNFFYFKDDSNNDYLEKLMKRKGFIEKFAILRLPRIMFNFIDCCDKNYKFTLEKTYPYFDSNNNSYSIDLVFSINVDDIENDEERGVILNEIIPIMNKADEYFQEKMSI